jgi:hypothetical protein
MEAIEFVKVQNLDSNFVIIEIFFKVHNVAIDFRKLWIYQIPNLTLKGRNKSLMWMAM